MCVLGYFQPVPPAALSAAAWYNIGLVVVLVALGVAVVAAYRAWWELNEEIEPATPEEVLASITQARADGELNDDEYERVLRQFGKQAPGLPAANPNDAGEVAGNKPEAQAKDI